MQLVWKYWFSHFSSLTCCLRKLHGKITIIVRLNSLISILEEKDLVMGRGMSWMLRLEDGE